MHFIGADNLQSNNKKTMHMLRHGISLQFTDGD